MNLLVQGLYGLGDNIYQRPFIRAALERNGKLWLQTCWPELYRDLKKRGHLYFVHPETKLRTQAKNVSRSNPGMWARLPDTVTRTVKLRYGPDLCRSNIIRILERQLPLGGTPFTFDLPDFLESVLVRYPQPMAVVRPVTRRKEWNNAARNPDPRYVQEAVRTLKASGFYVVSVADIEPGKEDYVDGPLEGCDQYLDQGQLSVVPLLAMIQAADLVVGGVGWIVPACIAAKTPLFVILGGQGGHNAPERITDPRMDLSRFGYAMPDKYCTCVRMGHNCNKTISFFESTFRSWLNGRDF